MYGQRRSAFTLVELLVVIAIIGTLVALLLPAVQAAREAARRSQCVNNLKQIGLAVQMHHDTRKQFPTGRFAQEQQGPSWAFLLLPQLEHNVNYESYDPKLPVFDEANSDAMRTPVETFVCPSRRTPAADRDFDNNDQPPVVVAAAPGGDYAANAGLHYRFGSTANPLEGKDPALVAGPIHTRSRVKARQVTDGLSQTMAIGEKHIPTEFAEDVPPEQEHQAAGDTAYFAGDRPETIFAGTENGIAEGTGDTSSDKFGSEHSQLVHFVFLDGHVSPLQTSIDEEALKRLSTIADGQVVDLAGL